MRDHSLVVYLRWTGRFLKLRKSPRGRVVYSGLLASRSGSLLNEGVVI